MQERATEQLMYIFTSSIKLAVNLESLLHPVGSTLAYLPRDSVVLTASSI